MRALVLLGFAVGLFVFAFASGGETVSAQVGYGTPTPTPSATTTATATATATATPGDGDDGGGVKKPKVKIALLGGGSVRTGLQVRVHFNTSGKVRLQARIGSRGVGGTSAKFKRKGRKLKRIRFRNVGEPPVRVTIKARGRSKDGRKAKLVKKKKTIRN